MLNRMLLLLAGLALSASATGCCCLGGCFGANRCNPCNPCNTYYGASSSPCGPGGCAPTYGMPPTGYLGSSTEATAFGPTTTISSTVVPPAYPTTQTVMMPPLPTY